MKLIKKKIFFAFVVLLVSCAGLTFAADNKTGEPFIDLPPGASLPPSASYDFVLNDGATTYYCTYLNTYEGQYIYTVDVSPSGKGFLFYSIDYGSFTVKVFHSSYWYSYSQEGYWTGCGSTYYNANCNGGLFSGTMSCGPLGDCTPPPYNPEKWNDGGSIQSSNNCYNYANDEITMTFAQPGRAHGCYPYSLANCDGVYAGAQCDGLIPLASGDDPCPDNMHRVYLVVAPGYDYHWYRQDIPDGRWSHKPGGTQATDRDNSGQLIYSPETADTGYYTLHCGYMCACGDNADIQ